jgi:hypothetical protein
MVLFPLADGGPGTAATPVRQDQRAKSEDPGVLEWNPGVGDGEELVREEVPHGVPEHDPERYADMQTPIATVTVDSSARGGRRPLDRLAKAR